MSDARSAIVLGGGIVGLCSAIALLRRGWSVILVERGSAAGASFGNAAIIQTDGVEPHPMPRDPMTLARIARGRSNAVHAKVGTSVRHAASLARYWLNSEPRRLERISAEYSRLVASAAQFHLDLADLAGCRALYRRSGYRIFCHSQAELDEFAAYYERLRDRYGVPFTVEDPEALRRAEPVLRDGGAGAVHLLGAWTVADPGALLRSLSQLFVRSGGSIVVGEAQDLKRHGSGWKVVSSVGSFDAANVVIALGAWSPRFLKGLDVAVPMLPIRGYHRHFRAPVLPNAPIFDAANAYVLSPVGRDLRLLTGAHLCDLDEADDHRQLEKAEKLAGSMIELGQPADEPPWSGTRPFMTGMVPWTRQLRRDSGLWANFGHGYQGLTLGPASGERLAGMMESCAF